MLSIELRKIPAFIVLFPKKEKREIAIFLQKNISL
jgi:hypothetical protein